jgi:exonuclease SbcC
MRPIALKLKNFGPFLDEYIDFTRVENNELFLISGKTGSGKTMIFDAIVYALFGEASTKNRKEGDLRSHFADNKQPMSVEFEFKLGNEHFYVERKGSYLKEGNTTKTNGSLEICELINGNHELRESKINAGNQLLKSLLGVNAEQFRQLFILPQGEFKRFLLSNSKDKQEILRTLFDSERFEEIQKLLADDVKEIRTNIEKNYAQLENYWLDLNNYDDNHLTAIKETNVRQTDKLIDALPEFEKIGDELQLKLEEQQQLIANKVQSTQQEVDQNEQLQENLKKLEEQRNILKSLAEEDKHINELRNTLNEINEVKPLATFIDNQKSLVSKQQSNDTKITQVTSKKEKLTQKNTALKEQLVHIQQSEDTIKTERKFVEKTNSFYQNLTKYKQAYDDKLKLKDQFEKANKLLEKEYTKQTDLKEQLTGNKPSYENLEAMDSKIYKLDNQVNENKVKQENKNRYDHLTSKIASNNEALGQAKEQLAKLTAEYEHIDKGQLQLNNKEELIAQIQSVLAIGDTCPVCGHKVDNLQQHINFDALLKKQQQLTKLDEQIQHFKTQQLQLETVLEQLNEQQQSFSNRDIKVEDISQIKTQLSEQQHARKKLKNQIDKVNKMKEQYQQLVDYIHKLEIDVKTQQSAIKQNEILINDFEHSTSSDNIEDFRKDFESKQNHITSYDKQIDSIEQQINNNNNQYSIEENSYQYLSEQAGELDKELAELELKVKNEMSRIGFSNMEQVEQAIVKVDMKAEIEQHIQNHDKSKQAAETLIQELETTTRDKELSDPDALKVQLSQLQDELNQITTEVNQHTYKVKVNKQKIADIKSIVDTLNNELKTQQEVFQLAEVVSGKNSQKLTLENFVLIHYLERILAQANQRLAMMTSQRYQLTRRTQVSQGYSGLEIDVYDAYANQARHISSLSGGESFQASLALALGLSEVVQQEAGGIVLESMFIDEGFGTLDQETLETALDTLLGLKSSGRMVGIISHVSELKQRIPLILEVKTDQYQSYTQFKQQ